jgi:oligopeptide transport system ATP-binding protein
MAAQDALIKVDDLTVHFPIRKGLLRRTVGQVRAVDGVSFEVRSGETLGLVGESGCGKSTTVRALLRLVEPTAGSVWYDGEDIARLPRHGLRRHRRALQMVFQDPYASLNPRMTVARIVGEPLDVHGLPDKRGRVRELLDLVGLPADAAARYPHEFSGGQRQRIGIARALATSPAFVACDEPVSALDVSIQAQVINLLRDLQERLGLTYLFIAHDLAVVRTISTRVAVMYLGQIVETAPRDELFAHPRHPYTKALLSAVPVADPVKERQRERIILTGDPPSPSRPPSGCRFHTRCPLATERCRVEVPMPRIVASEHVVACHLA